MLVNVRIRDTGRLAARRERSEVAGRRWRAKKVDVSPFSQLAQANGRVLETSPSAQLSPSISGDSGVDDLAECIKGCSLHEQSVADGSRNVPSTQQQRRSSLLLLQKQYPDGEPGSSGGPATPAAAVQPLVPQSPSSATHPRRAVVRLERCSLQKASAEHSSTPASSGETPRGGGVTPSPIPHSSGRSPLTPITPTQPSHLPPFSSPLLSYLSPAHCLPLSPREKVLTLCGQSQPLSLSDLFTSQMVESVEKLGEGTFSEVFGCTSDTGSHLAIKIIPIEGSRLYNDEPQTTYQDVLTEMVIMKELGLLGDRAARENSSHFTENFLKIHEMTLTEGEYPAFLLESWDAFAKSHPVENDRPDLFPEDQLYVVMATEDAGTSLENYQFSKVEEAVSVLCQVAGALAVGEAALEMEHRDLHMSNVLVKKTRKRSFTYRLDRRTFKVPSRGVKATVVDYTLSRVKQGDCVSFSDLVRLPWLFEGEGDLQFDVYRDMKKATGAQWNQFHPCTNVLWLTFLVAKLSERALEMDSLSRRSWRAGLRPLVRNTSRYHSAQDAFLNLFSSQN